VSKIKKACVGNAGECQRTLDDALGLGNGTITLQKAIQDSTLQNKLKFSDRRKIIQK